MQSGLKMGKFVQIQANRLFFFVILTTAIFDGNAGKKMAKKEANLYLEEVKLNVLRNNFWNL